MFSILSRSEQATDTSEALFSAPAGERRRAERIFDAALEKAKKNGPFAEVMAITPALAEVMLERNPSNRKISKIGVARYCADIKSGEWAITGDTVKIAVTGEVNDGQHRLTAIRETGVTMKTFVAFGLSRDSRTKLDQGIRRTVGSVLTMSGIPDGNNLAHAARIAWQYLTHGTVSRNPERQPTNAQIQQFVAEHPTLSEGLTYGRLMRKQKLAGLGLYAGIHHVLSLVAPSDAVTFSTTLTENIGYEGKSDPLYVLHKRLAEGHGTLSDTTTAAFIIKAWNSWRNEESIRVLKFVDGEQFPKAI